MLVECKKLIKDEKELAAAVAQIRSYALWVVPACYVITDGGPLAYGTSRVPSRLTERCYQ